GRPARCRAANARPQVDVLDAVVQEELGLEVLPARADPRGVSRPGGRRGREAAQAAPEGVMGHVHHREVDRSRCASAVVLGRHVLPPGQVAIPMAWWIVPGWPSTWSIRRATSTRGTDVPPLRLRPYAVR